MTKKRFEVIMNEFDEVEYIMDKEMMEDRDFADFMDFVEEVCKENEQLKQLVKKLEKQIYLIHMSSMFSTVKSFKGDVSKRYKYSEETDTIYDTANTYGQYNKVLDKKEVVMLLNEYETLLGDNVND